MIRSEAEYFDGLSANSCAVEIHIHSDALCHYQMQMTQECALQTV